MQDDLIKIVPIKDDLIEEVKAMFLRYASDLIPDDVEKVEFSSDYIGRKGEEITYIEFSLPESFKDIESNQADIPDYRVGEDENPKSIFWYDNGRCLFQIFNNSNLLDRRYILNYSPEKKYTKLRADAFIIDNKIHALYDNGRLYFQSITIANMIFPLLNYVNQATERDVERLCELQGLNVNVDEVKKVSNSKTRRLITLVLKSGNVNAFSTKSKRKKIKLLKDYDVNTNLDEDGNLILPTNKASALNSVLQFLNEDIFKGAISERTYRTNSKTKNN